jgi:hypothetical protein
MSSKNPVEDLQEIRKMMEGSSKFLSLSGLSGVVAGVVALIGSWLAWVQVSTFTENAMPYYMTGFGHVAERKLMISLAFIAAGIFVFAIAGGFLFTWLKAKRQGVALSTPLSWRLLFSLLLPLFFGGCFVLVEVKQFMFELILPSTLIFYGMALLNASKYVHVDIKYLAVCEMILGIVGFWMYDETWPMQDNVDVQVLIWALGFGVLHILYGTIMYFRYDYKKE